MAISVEQAIPKWIAQYYVIFPPIVFLMAVLFGWGLFFEIDQRLMFVVSFAEFLLLFVIFLSVAFFLASVALGFPAAIFQRGGSRLLRSELRISSILNYVMIGLMIGSPFLPGRWNIYAEILTGLFCFWCPLFRPISVQKLIAFALLF